MTILTQAYYQQRLTQEKASLDALIELRAKIEANPRRSYEFDSGDGRVTTRFWSLSEIDDTIAARESTIEYLSRKICRRNLMSVRLVR